MYMVHNHLNQELFNVGKRRKDSSIKITYSNHKFLYKKVPSVGNPAQKSLAFSSFLLLSGTPFEGF